MLGPLFFSLQPPLSLLTASVLQLPSTQMISTLPFPVPTCHLSPWHLGSTPTVYAKPNPWPSFSTWLPSQGSLAQWRAPPPTVFSVKNPGVILNTPLAQSQSTKSFYLLCSSRCRIYSIYSTTIIQVPSRDSALELPQELSCNQQTPHTTASFPS